MAHKDKQTTLKNLYNAYKRDLQHAPQRAMLMGVSIETYIAVLTDRYIDLAQRMANPQTAEEYAELTALFRQSE